MVVLPWWEKRQQLVGSCLAAKQFGVAIFAVSFGILLGECATSKWVHTEGTDKVFRVPFLLKSIDTAPSDWLTTTRAQCASLLVVVDFAEWLSIVFIETTISKCLVTVLADKVFRVPRLTQSIDTVTFDGLIARTTLWCKDRVEVLFAIRSAISFKECSSFKGLQALSANEVVHVPLLA